MIVSFIFLFSRSYRWWLVSTTKKSTSAYAGSLSSMEAWSSRYVHNELVISAMRTLEICRPRTHLYACLRLPQFWRQTSSHSLGPRKRFCCLYCHRCTSLYLGAITASSQTRQGALLHLPVADPCPRLWTCTYNPGFKLKRKEGKANRAAVE